MNGPKKLKKVIKFNEKEIDQFEILVKELIRRNEWKWVGRNEIFSNVFGKKKMESYELKLANH